MIISATAGIEGTSARKAIWTTAKYTYEQEHTCLGGCILSRFCAVQYRDSLVQPSGISFRIRPFFSYCTEGSESAFIRCASPHVLFLCFHTLKLGLGCAERAIIWHGSQDSSSDAPLQLLPHDFGPRESGRGWRDGADSGNLPQVHGEGEAQHHADTG